MRSIRAALLLLPLLFLPALAQEGGRSLALQGVYDNGTIRLRWGTGSPVTWGLIRAGGIMLTRQEADEPSVTVLGGGPLRVWEEEEWRRRLGTVPAAAQVATLLRQETQELAGQTELAQADLRQNSLTTLLLMAEFDFRIAQGLALGYADSMVSAGKIYRYEISVRDDVHGDTIRAEVIVGTDQVLPLLPVRGLRGLAGDRMAELWWDRAPTHTGYYVERRRRGESDWRRIDTLPLLFAQDVGRRPLRVDSIPNRVPVQYRVVGIDPFGRESPASEAIEIEARDLTPPEPPYDLKYEKVKGGVHLTWAAPATERDLAGFGLLRSMNPDAGYRPVHTELLKPGTKSYNDTVSHPGTYFYRLIAADTAGNVSPMSVRVMAVIEDTIPASSPRGLTALADTNGVVTLRWTHVREDDVKGYRLYRLIRGGRATEYVPITPEAIADTVWTDTLMGSVRDYFHYRVRSVDFAGNYSLPSEPVATRFPDVDPPERPIIDDYSVADRRVSLRFVSASRDVAAYEIRRTPVGHAGTELSRSIQAGRWVDSTAEHGVGYRYVVVAIDSAGHRSEPSKSLDVQPFWTVELERPPAPSTSYDRTKEGVSVSWRFPAGTGWRAVVLRRGSDGQLAQISPALETTSFLDTAVSTGSFEYAVKYYFPDQGGTEASPTAVAVVP